MAGRDAMQPSVGASVPKVDGAAKVTGAARYVDDLPVAGCWHGKTVRSRAAYGVLRALRRDPGTDWSAVVVVTAADIPGTNVIALIHDDQPALVPIGGTVRHVDEPIAIVAAPTRALAEAAAAALEPVMDEAPGVHSIEDALAAEIALHGDDNVFARYELRKGAADIDAVLAGCDVVIDGEYRTGAQEQMYIEPQGALAWWEGETCHVIGSMQCPFYVHKALVVLLGLDPERAVVSQAVTGGGFGGKEEYPSMIAARAALAARKAGRPVKIIYDRAEDIAATTKRHPARIRHRLGVRADGTFVACDVDVVIDGGAYATLSPVVLSRAVLHAAGPYRFESVRVTGRAVATNTPPHGAFRGFGAPQVTFAYERQVQKAARRLGLESIAIRRANMLREGDATATGQLLDGSVGSAEVLAAIERAQAGAVPPARRLGTAASPLRRGRGVALYFHGAGFTGSGEQRLAGKATVAAVASGGFEVRASSTDIGQGAITTFCQLAADALGVPLERVAVAEPATDRVPDSGPTVASRTCMVVGGVVERAAREVRMALEAWARATGIAGELTELAARYAAEHGELARTCTYESPPGIAWDDATYTGAAYPTYGWAACLVDVAIDLDTYEVAVERCVQAVDVGKAIHPVIVAGQIEGGTLQALGWALWEKVGYDRGRVINASMTDCIIPTSWDAPELDTVLVEKPYAHGPHGAKGVGEIPMDGPAAAVANAIEAALGAPIDALPALPEVIALAARGRALR
jgi:CO/xanthine dehydrogenase Mo-binding subunit